MFGKKMKPIFKSLFILLLAMSFNANAALVDGIYVDDVTHATYLDNSGEGSELAWINEVLIADGIIYDSLVRVEDFGIGDWVEIQDGIYNFDLASLGEPGWYVLKIGGNLNQGNADGFNNTLLFDNFGDMDLGFATISLLMLEDWSNLVINNFDIMRVSHLSTVPVPAAVWLFGTGLVGLIGFSKRRKAA